jgi:succinate dehydrogenase/fumarate reductase cytochrome b subunit
MRSSRNKSFKQRITGVGAYFSPMGIRWVGWKLNDAWRGLRNEIWNLSMQNIHSICLGIILYLFVFFGIIGIIALIVISILLQTNMPFHELFTFNA